MSVNSYKEAQGDDGRQNLKTGHSELPSTVIVWCRKEVCRQKVCRAGGERTLESQREGLLHHRDLQDQWRDRGAKPLEWERGFSGKSKGNLIGRERTVCIWASQFMARSTNKSNLTWDTQEPEKGLESINSLTPIKCCSSLHLNSSTLDKACYSNSLPHSKGLSSHSKYFI